MQMNKSEIIQKFIESIEAELSVLKKAAKDTADYATDSENKPENKYDTRGLEASYLAGAQAQRVAEMRDVLLCFRSTTIKKFHEQKNPVVAISALVEAISNDKTSYLLIMPLGGGQTIKIQDETVQVVTPNSPLGKALIGQAEGEVITILAGGAKREYEIASII
jgi:transcription elongation GreA/GreB family factor